MKRNFTYWAKVIGFSTIMLAVMFLVLYGCYAIASNIGVAVVHCIKNC